MCLLQICVHAGCSCEVKHRMDMQIFHPEAFYLKINSMYSSFQVHALRLLLAEHIT